MLTCWAYYAYWSDVAVTNRISAVLTGAGGAELGLRIDVDAGGDMVDEEDDLGD